MSKRVKTNVKTNVLRQSSAMGFEKFKGLPDDSDSDDEMQDYTRKKDSCENCARLGRVNDLMKKKIADLDAELDGLDEVLYTLEKIIAKGENDAKQAVNMARDIFGKIKVTK